MKKKHSFPTLAEQIANKCIHYNGLSGPGMKDDSSTKCCRAGVQYASVADPALKGKGFAQWPCFREGESVPCDKRHFPTPEEVAAEVAESDASFARLTIALTAVNDDAAAKGYKKGSGGGAIIDCPVCKAGKLHYTVAGYNGHIHGRCTTSGCVSWIQ